MSMIHRDFLSSEAEYILVENFYLNAGCNEGLE